MKRMRGIILAAGKGLRLNGTTGNTPKCLIEIGGYTLLERQLQTLKAFGIDDRVVVVGYEAERVQHTCDTKIRFVENRSFAETNSLYSLWLAREQLTDGFIVINSDVLFHPQLLARLIDSPYEDALLMEPLSAGLGDEEMKVKVRGERVVDISKTINPNQASGENLGLVKFGPSGARSLIEIMDRLIAEGCLRDWAPRAFCEFAAERPLYAIETCGYPWIEIDFPEDYQKAVHEILPKIAGTPYKAMPSVARACPAPIAEYFS
jgi:L-glutamine-phosphate cytidylyltransferase